MTEPSLKTHLPMMHIRYGSEVWVSWVDRTTGEMIPIFDIEAYDNFSTSTGITGENYQREMMGGYLEDEAKALMAEARELCPNDSPERTRIWGLAKTWMKTHE